MKNLLSIFLLAIYLLQPLQTARIYISFKINQEFITKVFCTNKEKPELKCNGKCHLKKEIKNTEEKKKKAPLTNQTKEQVQIACKAQTLADNLFPSVWNLISRFKHHSVLDILQSAVYLIIVLLLIILIPALVVGLIVSMFQAATSINEQTLTFIPKLLVTFSVLMYAGPYMLGRLTEFMMQMFINIPLYIGGG